MRLCKEGLVAWRISWYVVKNIDSNSKKADTKSYRNDIFRIYPWKKVNFVVHIFANGDSIQILTTP